MRSRQRRGGGERASPTAPTAWLALATLAAAVALLPIAYLFVRALERGPGVVLDVVWRERTVALLLRSLALGGAVTAVCLVLGIGLAYLTIRTDLPGRRAWTVIAVLPLAVPSYVASYVWVSFAPGLPSFAGAVLVLSACSYPYVFLPVAAALRRADSSTQDVARSLGDGPWRAFARVTLRQVRHAAGAGGLLVMLYVLSDFGAVAIWRFDAFTRVIHASYRSSFDRTPAAVLGLLLVLLTIAITLAETRTRGRGEPARVGSGAAAPAAPVPLGAWRVPACLAAAGVAVVSLGVPAAGLLYWLARGSSAGTDVDVLAAAVATTLSVAVAGGIVTLALALPVGWLAARHHGRAAVRFIEHATYAGHALPGVVVALSLVFLGVRYAQPLYQRTPMLVLAYVVLFLPLAVGAVRASVAQSSVRLEEVARSLGRPPRRVMREVTLPLAAPGVAAGALLVVLAAMKELPATLLLHPTGMDTLATRLWTFTDAGAHAAAAPYAAGLVLLAAVPALLLGGALPAARGARAPARAGRAAVTEQEAMAP